MRLIDMMLAEHPPFDSITAEVWVQYHIESALADIESAMKHANEFQRERLDSAAGRLRSILATELDRQHMMARVRESTDFMGEEKAEEGKKSA
ncbi:hypothetical protein IT575_12035 [bacterium]|nr:hypothetical protein [bacterium]